MVVFVGAKEWLQVHLWSEEAHPGFLDGMRPGQGDVSVLDTGQVMEGWYLSSHPSSGTASGDVSSAGTANGCGDGLDLGQQVLWFGIQI